MSTLDNTAVRDLLRFRLLWEAGQQLGEIISSEEIENAYETILQQVSSFSKGSASIYLWDSSKQELVLRARFGLTEEPEIIRRNQGTVGRVIEELKTIHSSVKGGSEIVTPIQFKESFYGALCVSNETANSFNIEDVRLIEGVARQLGITIHRVEALRTLEAVKQTANDAELMSTLGQSVMDLAHNLVNELGTWPFYLEALREDLESHETATEWRIDKLDYLLTSSSRVKQQLKDLRNGFVSLQSREPTTVSVTALLDESLLTTHIPKNITIDRQIQEDLPLLSVVTGQVINILNNLFINSSEAMPDGGKISVRVTKEVVTEDLPQNVLIEITDTGAGILPMDRERIFQLFFSTKNSSGFGLWSARQYARANGGDLVYQERPNQGATFILRLPIAIES